MTDPGTVGSAKSPQAEAAARTAALWAKDWGIYFAELQQLMGVTLEQAMLFEMLCTWLEIQRLTRESHAFVQKHIQDEQRGEWENP